MRRLPLILLATTAIGLASSQVASAADLPVKAAPLYVPPFTWTGPYIGGVLGYSWGHDTVVDHEGASDPSLSGFVGGVAVGWNWQVNPWWVLGVEAEGIGTGIDGTGPCGSIDTCHTKIPWMVDLTGRVGYAWDRALFYVKGGVVFADSEYTRFNPFLGYANATDERTGWLVGAGIEYAFAPNWPNWSAKIEYNFMDFGTQTEAFHFNGPPCCFILNSDVKQQVNVIKAGITYRFNWPP